MDRSAATAIILEVLEMDPDRVFEVIANVVRSMAESGRYSADEISVAIDELWQELESHRQPRH